MKESGCWKWKFDFDDEWRHGNTQSGIFYKAARLQSAGGQSDHTRAQEVEKTGGLSRPIKSFQVNSHSNSFLNLLVIFSSGPRPICPLCRDALTSRELRGGAFKSANLFKEGGTLGFGSGTR